MIATSLLAQDLKGFLSLHPSCFSFAKRDRALNDTCADSEAPIPSRFCAKREDSACDPVSLNKQISERPDGHFM